MFFSHNQLQNRRDSLIQSSLQGPRGLPARPVTHPDLSLSGREPEPALARSGSPKPWRRVAAGRERGLGSESLPQLPQALPRTRNQPAVGGPERILGSFGVGVKFNSPFSSYYIFTQKQSFITEIIM